MSEVTEIASKAVVITAKPDRKVFRHKKKAISSILAEISENPEILRAISILPCNFLRVYFYTFTSVETIILGDITYGACCIVDYTARALEADLMGIPA
ncbi:hypothetical protein AVEN_198397-1 [Araneus ventricosus]|uniref:Uncharacterized protein n=1 Tax=Araneus ventricosus TaxID=182803 RepID=A0A4Y2FJG9_ARAVE|nr:hypothetical protein AVEN_198397-1 [Araneus ventricosus]